MNLEQYLSRKRFKKIMPANRPPDSFIYFGFHNGTLMNRFNLKIFIEISFDTIVINGMI